MAEKGYGIDWGTAEALAFGSLLLEGNHVRITGQDVQRGTFSHRHAVVKDQITEKEFTPLNFLAKEMSPAAPMKHLSLSDLVLRPLGGLGRKKRGYEKSRKKERACEEKKKEASQPILSVSTIK